MEIPVEEIEGTLAATKKLRTNATLQQPSRMHRRTPSDPKQAFQEQQSEKLSLQVTQIGQKGTCGSLVEVPNCRETADDT